MSLLDCSPQYSYRPAVTTSGQQTAPFFDEKRARLLTSGTFFRSKNAGAATNEIEIEIVIAGDVILNVYKDGLQETFGPVTLDIGGSPCSPISAPALRVLVNGISNLIEMPTVDQGGVTVAAVPYFDSGIDETCIFAIMPTQLSGGDGPPSDDASLTTVHTGPDRTMVILSQTEIINNEHTDPGLLVDPTSERVRQWNGMDWVDYVPNEDCRPFT